MGDTVWVEYNWHFDAKIKSNGMEIHSDGRESEIFRKIDGGWKIVHIHYSGPAVGRNPGRVSVKRVILYRSLALPEGQPACSKMLPRPI